MTREEAAKILKYPVYKWSLDWDDREDGLEYSEAIQMAVAALRAQQKLLEMLELDRDAWKLCDGCRPNRFFGNRFCCRCGRPLTEEAWAELERRIGGNDETVR